MQLSMCFLVTTVTLVEVSGLEPPTPTLSGWCSNRLSYIPSACFSDFINCHRCAQKWSNSPYQGGALTG